MGPLYRDRLPDGAVGADAVRMDAAQVIAPRNLTVRAGHGQIYVMADYPEFPEEWDEAEDEEPAYVTACAKAYDSGHFVGVERYVLNVLTPGQRNSSTPMRLEVWSSEPDDDLDDWDHEVDLDFDVPAGKLAIGEPAAFLKDLVVEPRIPPGRYRVRVSGRGFTAVGAAGANGDDSYRLRFWLRDGDSAAVLRRRWPGWEPEWRRHLAQRRHR